MLFRDKTNNDSEQTGTFDEGADDDSRHPVVVSLLRLARAGLKGSRTNLTDTESGSESSQGSTNSSTYSTQRESLKQNCRK